VITLATRGTPLGLTEPLVCKVVRDVSQDTEWPSRVLVTRTYPTREAMPAVNAVICEEELTLGQEVSVPVVHHTIADHLHQGDVVSIDTSGKIRTVYRRASPHNTLFATERCNSFCVMCSQPPRDIDDQWRIDEMLRTVALIDPATSELGISGGEPTLLGDGLISVIRACRDHLPRTALHILSNGRLFRYTSLARAVADIGHPDLMFGIPVYSDLDNEHDHVVQARGAFEDTILGLYKLARFRVPVEIRVVIHEMTYRRLESLAEFIYRNLPFASHVALMGLEATGFAKGNMQALWIDPWDYRHQLERATLFLAERHMRVSVYNHQLCTVTPAVWPYCRQSISDWKNEYVRVCDSCAARTSCGGFFSFNVKTHFSRHLSPISDTEVQASSLDLTSRIS
jgi:His-Xaa-Ser system radical SAM maturase HxsC